MFDDITDEEYAEWKEWFDAGYHNWLACIILVVIATFVVLAVLGSLGSEQKTTRHVIQKSGAGPDFQQGESPDEGSDSKSV
jgi:hypothetical protein